MKIRSFIIGVCAFFFVGTAIAQAPEKISYQAIVRNSNGELVKGESVSVQVSILEGTSTGTTVYSEVHTQTTNVNGLVTLSIGEGTVQSGTFSSIDWGNNIFFLKTGVDPQGGTDYSIESTQQFLSVPYALYAKTAGNSFSGSYNDLTDLPSLTDSIMTTFAVLMTDPDMMAMLKGILDLPQTITISNDTISLSDGGFIKLPAGSGFSGDYDDLTNKPTIPTNLSQLIRDLNWDTLYHTLSISNDTITLSNGGGSIKLPAGFSGDYNDLTNLPSLNDSIISTFMVLLQDPDMMAMFKMILGLPENLSIRNDSLLLSGGGAGLHVDSLLRAFSWINVDLSELRNDSSFLTYKSLTELITDPYVKKKVINLMLNEIDTNSYLKAQIRTYIASNPTQWLREGFYLAKEIMVSNPDLVDSLKSYIPTIVNIVRDNVTQEELLDMIKRSANYVMTNYPGLIDSLKGYIPTIVNIIKNNIDKDQLLGYFDRGVNYIMTNYPELLDTVVVRVSNSPMVLEIMGNLIESMGLGDFIPSAEINNAAITGNNFTFDIEASEAITHYGICWSSLPFPAIEGANVVLGTGTVTTNATVDISLVPVGSFIKAFVITEKGRVLEAGAGIIKE